MKTYQHPAPEAVLLDAIDRRETLAINEAKRLNQSTLPESPSHWKYCDFCGDPPFRRGSGVIRMSVSYSKNTGDLIHVAIPSHSLCPACCGHGYVLTHIGAEARRQKGVA